MKNRVSLDDPDYNQNQQVMIRDNKAKKLWLILGIIAAIIIIIGVALQNGGSGKNKIPDPNRTQEDCTFLGTANVYPASHANGLCYQDGDGWYNPVFGHHHHK